MIIQLNSHDVLGKLSIIKNYLSVLDGDTTLTPDQKKLLAPAFQTTQEIIDLVKKLSEEAKKAAGDL